ncbi:uncharacterized protein LOC131659230 [Vicia villosa]|uniref:uncharacterized protein LOC131659230 n=1 Tax=Vicia villosa TaxID=3911 RepID=UPI00273B0030|nr:uncharacterized protein LOC131659230 [Vicia villosa]
MSKIDIFLLSDSFIDNCKVAGQIIGGRDISDHAPIWIKDNRKDWGPKAFKFNNSWLKHKDFNKFVEEEWSKIQAKGKGKISEEVVRKRAKVVEYLRVNLNKKEGLLRLKSRKLWLSEGDRNSRVFHNSLGSRKGRNSLCSLDSKRGRLEEVAEIKDFIFEHFNRFFKEAEVCRPEPKDLGLTTLSSSERMELDNPFFELEVKEAI